MGGTYAADHAERPGGHGRGEIARHSGEMSNQLNDSRRKEETEWTRGKDVVKVKVEVGELAEGGRQARQMRQPRRPLGGCGASRPGQSHKFVLNFENRSNGLQASLEGLGI